MNSEIEGNEPTFSYPTSLTNQLGKLTNTLCLSIMSSDKILEHSILIKLIFYQTSTFLHSSTYQESNMFMYLL